MSKPSINEQQARLTAAKRKVRANSGSDHLGSQRKARRVLEIWLDGTEHSDGLEGAPLIEVDEWICEDCGEYEQLYQWSNWGRICPLCSFARVENNGQNPRHVEYAEQKLKSMRKVNNG